MSSLSMVALALASLTVSAFSFGYNESLAERLVAYAGASYCAGSKSVTDWDCYACKNNPGFTHITSVHDSKTDGRGIVGYDTNLGARVVAFMGTNGDIKTWIDDLLIIKRATTSITNCMGCKVHSGFLAAYDGLREQVYTALEALPAGKLYITGHSLGAALATHCAIDLLEARGVRADAIYTVGQPRVGNSAFASYFDSTGLNIFRVTHHRDPIPHLPYEWMGYRHIAHEVYYQDATKSGPTKICSTSNGEDPSCADQFSGLSNGNLIFIPDHWTYLKFSFAADIIHCTLAQETVTV